MKFSPRHQGGFVLVLTLWVLAITTVAASYFSERVARVVELARQSRQNVQAWIDLADTRAEILFRIGTVPITVNGLGVGSDAIALDDRPYRGLGTSVVRLQDNRGLLNLNIVDDDRLHRFLGVLGIPGDQRARMIDTLRDYIDEDNFRRLNGAEEKDYAEQGLPPPRNSRLLTPWEAQRIISWRDKPQLWEKGQLAALTTTSFSVALNPNTAPWQVLATLPGVTNEIAQAMISRRRLQPIVSVDQVAALSGTSSQQLVFQIITLPSDAIRITQTAPGLPRALQYNVSLTPNGEHAPWRIDYYTQTGFTYRDDKIEEIPELPPRLATPLPPVYPRS